MIQPSTTIYLLKNLDNDSGYMNTYYFTSLAQQQAFFLNESRIIVQFSPTEYQRQTRNTLKINAPYSMIREAVYMAFKNSAYENKMYYAFVNEVNYVSDNVTEVKYTLDVLQTYFFDVTLKESFILRNHVSDDTIGANTQPESLDIGTLVKTNSVSFSLAPQNVWLMVSEVFIGKNLQGQTIPIWSIFGDGDGAQYSLEVLQKPDNWSGATGSFVNGTYYSGLTNVLEGVGFADYTKVLNAISNYVTAGKADAIVDFFVAPNTPDAFETITLFRALSGQAQNNKVYTYPFSAIQGYTTSGSTGTYYPELFSGAYTFQLRGNNNPTPDFVSRPLNYQGGMSTENALYESQFMRCSFNASVYKTWLAQNRNNIAYQNAAIDTQQYLTDKQNDLGYRLRLTNNIADIAMNLTGMAISAGSMAASSGASALASGAKGLTSGAFGLLNSGLDIYANMLTHNLAKEKSAMQASLAKQALQATNADKQTIPSQHKLASTSTYFARSGQIEIWYDYMTLRPENLKKIDNYFSRYGYAINKFEVPNRCTRKRFTYIQTAGCIVTGNISQTDKNAISGIYDNGVTFWNVSSSGGVDRFGDYTSANDII